MTPVNNKKISVILRIAVILVCLVWITLYLVSDLMARYVSSDLEKGSAQAASFHITTDLTDLEETFPLLLSPANKIEENSLGSEEIYFSVTNDSEVDVVIYMHLDAQGNIPVKIGCQEYVETEENGSGEESRFLDFMARDSRDECNMKSDLSEGQSKSYKLALLWEEGAAGYQYANGIGLVELSIQAVQKEQIQ